MEIEGVNTTRNDLFPFSALRVLGGLQIVLGAGCLVLGVLDLALLMVHYDGQTARYAVTETQKAEFETLVSLTVASAPVWCGIWFMVTGSLGAFVSRARSHSLKFLKIAFLVLSVLCSAFFAPACTVLSAIIAVTRHTMDHRNLQWMVTLTSAFLAFCEIGIAVTSASICCCCSPLKMAKVHILLADSEDRHSPPPMPAPRTLKEPFHRLPNKPKSRKPRLKEATVQTEPPPPPPAPRPRAVLTMPTRKPAPSKRLADPRYPILQRQPRDLDEEEEEDYVYLPTSSGSRGYDRLRKWALPSGRLY